MCALFAVIMGAVVACRIVISALRVPNIVGIGMLMDLIIADIAVGIAIGVSVGFTLRLGILAAVTFRVVLVLLLTIATVVKAVRPLAAAGQDLSAGSAGVRVGVLIVLRFGFVVGAAQVEAAAITEGIFILSVGMVLPPLSWADGANDLVIDGVPGFAVPGILVHGGAAVGANLSALGNVMGFALRIIIAAEVTFRVVLVLLCKIAPTVKAVFPHAVAVDDLIAGGAGGIVVDCIVPVFRVVVGAAQIEAAAIAEGIFILSVGMLLPTINLADGANDLVIRGFPGFAVPDILVHDLVAVQALLSVLGNVMGFALRIIIAASVT